jgi:hypothetical protein
MAPVLDFSLAAVALQVVLFAGGAVLACMTVRLAGDVRILSGGTAAWSDACRIRSRKKWSAAFWSASAIAMFLTALVVGLVENYTTGQEANKRAQATMTELARLESALKDQGVATENGNSGVAGLKFAINYIDQQRHRIVDLEKIDQRMKRIYARGEDRATVSGYKINTAESSVLFSAVISERPLVLTGTFEFLGAPITCDEPRGATSMIGGRTVYSDMLCHFLGPIESAKLSLVAARY